MSLSVDHCPHCVNTSSLLTSHCMYIVCHVCTYLGAAVSGGAPILPELSEGSDSSSSDAEMHAE